MGGIEEESQMEGRDPNGNGAGRKRKVGRLAYLLCGLVVLAGLSILSRGSPDVAESAPDWSSLEAEDRVPSVDEVLGYLDGKSVPFPEVAEDGVSLLLKKEEIRSLSIVHEDVFFTLATFEVVAGGSRFAYEVSINHHPMDGTYVFGEYRVMKSSRR
jgi:hypothetical protein